MARSAFIVYFLLLSCLWMCTVHCSKNKTSTKPKAVSFYMRILVRNSTKDKNFTAVLSAIPDGPSLDFSFGQIHIFDNPLTKGQSLDSKHLGRLQGFYGDVGQTNLTLFLVTTATLETKKYKGTLSFLGIDHAAEPVKQIPLVGGTGDFAFARGIATIRFINSQNINNQDNALFHYDIRLAY